MSKFTKKVVPLSDIKANQQNPRIISESKLKKLINSLLVFPKMMSLRPITVDSEGFVLGGNMRQTALGRIAQMKPKELREHLDTLPEYQSMTDDEQLATVKFWTKFLRKPQVEAQVADGLTDDERQQFIIKDNVSYGDWDYDELQTWDEARLESWGLDMTMPDFKVVGDDVNPDDFGDEFNLPEGDHADFRRYGFMLHDSQYERVLIALKMAQADDLFKSYCVTQQNTNENGNALSFILDQWVEQKKSS